MLDGGITQLVTWEEEEQIRGVYLKSLELGHLQNINHKGGGIVQFQFIWRWHGRNQVVRIFRGPMRSMPITSSVREERTDAC